MAAANGQSRVYVDRRYDDYASMKQHFRHRHIEEFVIQGTQLTTTAAAELLCTTGDTINYIAAEGQVYVRCEADDANQHSKYVYIEYQDDTGAVQDILTADLDATNSTTEIIVTGASDFFRLRRMTSEVESATGGGKAVILTDANMGGADDVFGFIDDNESEAWIGRYFVRDVATVEHSFIGRIKCQIPYLLEADATPGGYFLTVDFTPKPTNLGEVAAAANRSIVIPFSEDLDWQPLIELQPATDVTLKIHKLVDADHVNMYVEATYLEVFTRI